MNDKILKGDIFYVRSSDTVPPIGCEIWSDRPALVVSNDTTNQTAGAVEIVYLSTSMHKRPSPLHVRVQSGNRNAIAMCGQIHSVDKSRLVQKLGSITPKELETIDKALCFSLGIQHENYRSLFKKWENYIREYHIPVIEEIESMAAATMDDAFFVLRRQISVLTKERDGYKALAEAREEQLNAIQLQNIHTE